MAKILIVEDDLVIARNLRAWLENEKHTVDMVHDGDEGLYRLTHYPYDLAILDWHLPGKQGAEICEELRSSNRRIPILMLTARSAVNDKVKALDSGAYDYIVKPCDLQELSARVRALLRRHPLDNNETTQLNFGNLAINTESHEVLVDSKPLFLSPSEFAILLFLCQNFGNNFSSDKIYGQIRSNKDGSSQLIRVHITHLRQKLAAANSTLEILSSKGGGYCANMCELNDEPDPGSGK